MTIVARSLTTEVFLRYEEYILPSCQEDDDVFAFHIKNKSPND